MPTGKYEEEKLINLGSNRWVFRPQWGFARYLKNWILETYLSAWVFTTNKHLLVDNKLKQMPMGAIKFHWIRSFPRNWWLALDMGYAFGGTTYINDTKSDTRISTFRFGLTFALPLGQHHLLRFTGVTSVRLSRGSDYDGVALTYQYRWVR